ncbi:transcriptional regulator PpsR [Stappia stellulata]|uniref:transcriptional regulator PpsR n=1 Tax=Stappia stellulata TaxID=71235 RepID=UPI00068898AC|nr:transcriptional regulator PpsR [Stappia stellulata]
MQIKNIRSAPRLFKASAPRFDNVSVETAAQLASLGSDISLLIADDGTVVDIAYGDTTLAGYDVDAWVGRKWRDVVTVESMEKIDALLSDVRSASPTRRRQVNHPAPATNMPDLPVEYTLVTVEGLDCWVALGDDLRKIASIQNQLLNAQLELEREYRKIRDAETRYRTIFQKLGQPILIVDGTERKIVDANLAASRALLRPVGKLIGENIIALFEAGQRDMLGELMSEAQHSGTPRATVARLAEVDLEQSVALEPFRENGRNNLFMRLSAAPGAHEDETAGDRDATDVFETLPESLVTISLKGTIENLNDTFLDMVGLLNKERLIGRNLNNWLGGSAVDLNVLLAKVRDEGSVRQFATVVRDELGGVKPVTVSAGRFAHGGHESVCLLIGAATKRDSALGMSAASLAPDGADFSELIGRVPLKELIREAVDVIEKMCIEAALRQTDNNRASAADLLGLSRQSLYIKLRRHGLEDFGGGSRGSVNSP